MPKTSSVVLGVRIYPELIKLIDKDAEKNLRSRNQQIILLICKGLEVDPKPFLFKK